MNLTEQKRQGQNSITIYDALNAALMSIKICPQEGVVSPNGNELIISVGDTNAILISPKAEIKNYVYNLSKPLCYSEESYGEFHQEVSVVNNEIKMRAYVEWQEENGNVIEELEPIDLLLFKGNNIISTNYQNVDIEIIYPRNDEFNRAFLNTSIYSTHKKLNNSLSLDDLYFKDAFTKTNNDLNIEVDNLNVKCITSKNNKFSLDSEGNLIVNSITTNEGGSTNNNSSICDLIYPVGSIYLSVNSINPSTLFGGTWEEIAKGRTLVGVDTNDVDFNIVKKTGGEKVHKLTIDEMPSHKHDMNFGTSSSSNNFGGGLIYTGVDGKNTAFISASGGDQPHNNLQPYFTCYIWSRIA